MHPLAWLNHHQLQSVIRREHDWSFTFSDDAYLTVECLWRLLEQGRIRMTSEDDGHQFGLPAPVIATDMLSQRIAGSAIQNVVLNEQTLDLELHFGADRVLQVLPTSAGYEAWTCGRAGQQFIAVGGGELAIVGQLAGG